MAEFQNQRTGQNAGNQQDLQEEDVWGFIRNNRGRARPGGREQPTSNPRMIPRAAQYNSFQSHPNQRQFSAPVDIPDWTKMLKWRNGDNLGGFLGNNAAAVAAFYDDGWDDSEEEMLPPHEFILRRDALNPQIVSFSMCEGIGRTLKGRDLSRVRNAILTKTGFLEE